MRLLICFALITMTAGSVYGVNYVVGSLSDDLLTGYLLGAVTAAGWFTFVGWLDHLLRQRGA